MLLGDVLDALVRDESGRTVGHVLDARLVLDAPPAVPGAPLAGARLHGLLVCPRAAGSFLGYERTGVRAPAVLAWWFRRRYRGTFLVRWSDVVGVPDPEDPDRVDEENVVVLRDGFTRLDPRLPTRPTRPTRPTAR